jgi:hypothetical protein
VRVPLGIRRQIRRWIEHPQDGALYGLSDGFRPGRKHFAVVVGAITGTGGIVTGLQVVDAAMATSQNSATTIPSNSVLGVTSIAGGTVNVAVNAPAAAANAISAVAGNIAIFAVGQ